MFDENNKPPRFGFCASLASYSALNANLIRREEVRKARQGKGREGKFEEAEENPTMDRYQRVEKPRPESAINENEIRITTQGLIRNYISYATSLLQVKTIREIVLTAMGQAISKAVATAEILKRRIPGLHQNTAISSTSITDVWEPIEEGLLPLETTRHVSMITITLSPKPLDQTLTGYQPPLAADEVKQKAGIGFDGDSRGGRARGSGIGRGRFRGRGWAWARGWGRAGFRGRGRWWWGGRGRGRGRGFAAAEVDA